MPHPIASGWVALVVLVALGQEAGPATRPSGTERLVVERALEVRLSTEKDRAAPGFSAARTFELVAERSGPLTVLVDSYDADVLVERVDAEGRTIDGDDDGGVAWNARLVVDALADERYLLRVGFKQASTGLLTCLVREGVVEPPDGRDAVRARISFLEGRAQAALARSEAFAAADALHRAGRLAFDAGELVLCREVFETALEREAELGHEHLAMIARAYLGAVSVDFGELSRAESLLEDALERALDFSRRGSENGALLEGFARHQLGRVQLAQGDLSAARASFDRALMIAASRGALANEVFLCCLMGELELREGEPVEAAAWHARAIEKARAFGAPLPLAEALLSEGRFLEKRGEYAQARIRLQEALELAPNLYTRVEALGQLGIVATSKGEVLEAKRLFEEALEGAYELENAGLVFTAQFSLGGLLLQLGDPEEACERMEDALRHAGPGLAPVKRAEALRSLALGRMETSRAEEARELLDEALDLARRAQNERLEALIVATDVAWCYGRAQYERGRDLAERQIVIARELESRDLEAVGLANLAELRLRLGELEPAKALAAAALELHEELGSRKYLQRALLTTIEIAELERDRGAMDAAIVRAEECFEEASSLSIEQGSLLRAQDVYSLWGEYSQDLVALSLAAGLGPEEASSEIARGFRRAGEWKGRALWQGIAEHRRGGRDATTMTIRRERRALLAERESLLARLAGEMRAGAPEELLEDLRRRAHDLKQRGDELLARLKTEAPGDAALDAPTGVGPEELGSALGEQTALVEFVEGRRHVYSYVLWRGDLEFRSIGAREAVREKVDAYLDGLSRRESLFSPQQVALAGSELYELLLAPLLAGIPEDAPLVIVPSASFAALPFEALVVEAPDLPTTFAELTFVIDRRTLCYAASSPVLALLASTEPRRETGPALLLADPLFEDEPRRDAPLLAAAEVADTLAAHGASGVPRGARGGWNRLPGTRSEALAVAASLEALATGEEFASVLAGLEGELAGRRSGTARGRAFELCLGADATPDVLRGDLRRYSIVHCATHGWVDPSDPRRGGLVLSADAGGRALLELGAILELDLDLDLAVLSACDTGRGALLRGEGVQSMARAFQYAGARAVVASLWKVDDRATSGIMRELYTRRAQPGTKLPQALRLARLAERNAPDEQGPARGRPVVASRASPAHDGHPYYWAAFVAFCSPEAAAGLTSAR